MSNLEIAVIVIAVCVIGIGLRVARQIQHEDLSERAVLRRLDILESKVKLASEECEHKDMVMGARVNVLERRMAAYEAPDPFETIYDKEEDEQ